MGRCVLCAVTLVVAFHHSSLPTAHAEKADNKAKPAQWRGYEQRRFPIGDRQGYVVFPKEAAPGNPWVWRARFPNFHAEMDEILLSKGFHVGYVDVANLYGSPKAMAIGDQFYKYVTKEFGLAPRPCLEGVSRGGLFVYNWAADHPDKVACIYCDTPVCDFKSWPGGFGKGVGSPKDWERCLAAHALSESEAKTTKRLPIERAKTIAEAKIPVMHIVSLNDVVVPPAENTDRVRQTLRDHGHDLELIVVEEGTEKSKGHHFDHPDPQRVVDFIMKHAGVK
ncbi:Alpha/beta hydrolase family protein [Planctomycetes bacterium Pan216]|uniref:Alpha/beta hydrolase family protein n=1 Tax=Kolteria novifilia TaxID=2527975 RepID=A0A518B1D0_9BACT|nr:Alpha/beta hydrolase family protein [Planctomycetes bacterium Pan216]